MMKSSTTSKMHHEESTAIKGLLMLLIMLGHNWMLTHNPETGVRLLWKDWVYCFHVYCFFILPWFYGYKLNSGRVYNAFWPKQ